MADWTNSIELTHGDRVWVRRENQIEELPSLDLDPDSVPLLLDDPTLDRPMHGYNRGGITSPPALVREVRAAAAPVALYSAPLLNEGPSPHEKTPPTFDMGMMPAVWDDDEPTELGDDPLSPVERYRASMELADYDEDCPSTELVTTREALAAVALAKVRSEVPDSGTNWFVHTRRLEPDPETSVSLILESVEELFDSEVDDDMSLTLDLETDWLVPQEPIARQRPVTVRNHVEPLLLRTPTPAMERPAPVGLAARAPAPAPIRPLRSTVPSYLQTTPPRSSGSMAAWIVNTITFVCGISVGVAAATTIVALAATAALLV